MLLPLPEGAVWVANALATWAAVKPVELPAVRVTPAKVMDSLMAKSLKVTVVISAAGVPSEVPSRVMANKAPPVLASRRSTCEVPPTARSATLSSAVVLVNTTTPLPSVVAVKPVNMPVSVPVLAVPLANTVARSAALTLAPLGALYVRPAKVTL